MSALPRTSVGQVRQWVSWLACSEGSITHRAVRSGLWLVLAEAAARAGAVVRLIVVARLLSPADFGVLGIALAVLGWLELFTQTGIQQALVQKRTVIPDDLNTAFTIQVFRGVTLGATVAAAAPAVSWFFRADVTQIVQAVAVVVVLRGLTNPGVVYFRRELDFRRDSLWRAMGLAANTVTAIFFAFVLRNAWALVLSLVLGQAVETATSYWMSDFRPALRFSRKQASELIRFGKWVFWSNIVSAANLYLDSVAIGRLLGAHMLGLYQIGAQLGASPIQTLATHFGGITFPAFSKLSEVHVRRSAYLRTFRLLAAIVIPIACMSTLFARDLIVATIGVKWLGSVALVKILAWAGTGTAIAGFGANLLMGAGKPRVMFCVSCLRLAILALLLFPFLAWQGAEGVALAAAASAVSGAVVYLWLANRLFDSSIRQLAGCLKEGVAATVPYLLASLALANTTSAATFVGLLCAGLIHGLIVMSMIRRELRVPSADSITRAGIDRGQQTRA